MKFHHSICWILVLILIITLMPASVFAQEQTAPNQIITEIQEFPADISHQKIKVRSQESAVFPASITALLSESSEPVSINVSWSSDTDSAGTSAGVFCFTPELPEGYTLADSAVLPSVTIEVTKNSSSISGIAASRKKKSRGTLSDSITVKPAWGRTLSLQMKQNGKWVTKKTYRLKDQETSTLTITYPKDWWKVTSSSWRLSLSESSEGLAYTSPVITVKTLRYYQNPSAYIQIKDKITLRHSGGYNLKRGYMGLKVRKVNSYFKIGNKYWPRYTSQTQQKVRAFQKRKKLKVTGVVDKTTWKKMGFSESSWYNLGAYVSPIRVNPSSTRSQHVEAMISTARKYLGSDYVVGASGKPGQGADCSGLVMQGLYASGIDPYPVSCVRHSKAGYEYESRNLWKNKKFKTVPYTKKKRGDLIFYKGRGGAIIHVAIYLGKGKVIESWPNKVVIWPVKNSHRSSIAGVKRVFI